MIKHNQDGAINPLLLPLLIAAVFLVGAIGFAAWAFSSRQDYKNNVDQKIALATQSAVTQEGQRKDKQFAEASKNPLKTYVSPDEFGTINMQYPRTWSAYVDSSSSNNSNGLDGYFNPDVVPSITDQNATFALRLQVLNQSYSDVLQSFDNQDGVTVTPYALPKLPKVVGVKITGQIEQDKQGVMVVLPVRDKTLQVFTESTAYNNDFNNIILPNLTFSP